MRRISSLQLGVVGLVAACACVAACGKKDETPPPQQPGQTQPYGQQYPQQPGAYPQPGAQPGAYPQPGQPGAQPGAQPAPGGAQPGQMAVPGPAALPCQNDSQCITHRCNTQYGKCAWPCQSDVDCIQGAKCQVGLGAVATCMPGQ